MLSSTVHITSNFTSHLFNKSPKSIFQNFNKLSFDKTQRSSIRSSLRDQMQSLRFLLAISLLLLVLFVRVSPILLLPLKPLKLSNGQKELAAAEKRVPGSKRLHYRRIGFEFEEEKRVAPTGSNPLHHLWWWALYLIELYEEILSGTTVDEFVVLIVYTSTCEHCIWLKLQ